MQKNDKKYSEQRSVMQKAIEVSVYSCIYKVIFHGRIRMCTGFKEGKDRDGEIIFKYLRYDPSSFAGIELSL